MGFPLIIEIDDPTTGNPIVVINEPDYEPMYDPNVSGDLIEVDGFGIDSQGVAYFDSDDAAAGEAARVTVDEQGNITLIQ